jgi:hypothetical protein
MIPAPRVEPDQGRARSLMIISGKSSSDGAVFMTVS